MEADNLLPKREILQFFFDGRRVEANVGDTIGYALIRSRIYTVARSSKLHRRRGIRCGRGYCRSCLVNVNGIPNVPACITRVEDGMEVKSQNATPRASFDLLSILDYFSKLVSSKSIYEGVPGNFRVWPITRRVIDRIVGLGELPERTGKYESGGVVEVDVAIVGGGVSGLAAASITSSYGLKTLVIESMNTLGGRAKLDPIPDERLVELGVQTPKGLIEKLESNVKRRGVEILTSSDAYGLYSVEDVLGVYTRKSYDAGEHLLVKAKIYIVSTGGYEEPGNFLNNDIPGVLYDYAFRRMVLEFKIAPKKPVLIVGNSSLASRTKKLVERLKIECIGPVQDLDGDVDGERLVKVGGKDKVEWAIVESGSSRKKLKVDLVVVSKKLNPAGEIAWHAGISPVYVEDLECYVPKHDRYMETVNPKVLVAGRVVGARDYLESHLTGEIAGLTATLKILGWVEEAYTLREEKVKTLERVRSAK